MSGLLDNSAFYPGSAALPAPGFEATLRIEPALMQFAPELAVASVGGRDARKFPRCRLDFLTLDQVLVPAQWGHMVAEQRGSEPASYWCLIPQFGRVWRTPGDESGWSNAALPLMLVNDLENHAHQGLARFQYRGAEVREFRFQFVQQTSPYLLRQHFVAWGSAPVESSPLTDIDIDAARRRARLELTDRMPSRPWTELVSRVGAEALSGFAGGLSPKWMLMHALVRPDPGGADPSTSPGVVYYQDFPTSCGSYPYPLDMRFGVRSIMKSIAAPLSLLRLAQLQGPQVLDLKIGHYVSGLHERFNEIRFIDAANMATGFGGLGTSRTEPNDFDDGYFEGDYDGWYTAASHAEKVDHTRRWLRPYPWRAGAVLRYSDQDYYLLGAAVDGYLKSIRGPEADVWEMLASEVFEPIGIHAAPTTRTREPHGARGLVWFNAGYFPTLDDLAKITLLYQRRGEWGQRQILHRELTADLLAARHALSKRDGRPLEPEQSGELPQPGGTVRPEVPVRPEESAQATGELAPAPLRQPPTHYRMGFHFTPYYNRKLGRTCYLPVMWGAGESVIILYPNGLVSIRIGKAAGSADEHLPTHVSSQGTIESVSRIEPFG